MSKGGMLIKGTIILSAATLLTKVMGTLFWVPFQNIAGDAAMGVYRQSFPFYSILLMVATAGVPLTVSKFVAQRLPAGDKAGARRVMRVSSSILSLTGVAGFLLLFFGAGAIAGHVLDNPRTEASLRVLSFALLIVPIMAVLRGYFQGHQEMMPTALSQVAEQFIRVLTMVAVTWWMVDRQFGTETVAAGATLGAVTGAAGGLVVVLLYKRRDRLRHPLSPDDVRRAARVEPFAGLSDRILRYAVPVSLGSLVLPLINILDSITVPRILREAFQLSAGQAEVLYGIYGRGEPLVNLIATFSAALSLALVPAISSHISKGEEVPVRRKIAQAWLLTAVVSFPAAAGLALLARPVNVMLYRNSSEAVLETGTLVVAVLAFSTLFSNLALTSSGILQGLGHNRLPVRHLAAGAAVKVAANLVLIPFLGIVGSACALVLTYLVVGFLNMRSVAQKTGVAVHWRTLFLKPAFCSALMAAAMYASLLAAERIMAPGTDRLANTGLSFLLVVAGAVVYAAALLVSGSIGRAEIRLLPMGERLCRGLARMGLLRT